MANDVAFGFIQQEHLFAERITDRMIPTVQTAVLLSAQEHTRVLNNMLSELVQPTTAYSINYQLADGGELQPLDDDGNPRVTRPSGTYTVGFPIRGGGDAYGTNRVSRAKMTVADLNRITLNIMTKDARWMRRSMLSALFTNVAYTFTDPEHGAITVQPLALTSDGVTYVKSNGDASTDEHYYAQADAIDNTHDPFGTWYTELNEHPNNSGPYVAYIPTNLKSAVTGLASFEPARQGQVMYGADVTTAAAMVNMDATGQNSSLAGVGNNYLGYHSAGIHIVEWASLPDNYGFVVARGGDPVLGMRQHAEPELQGLFPEPFDLDGNHLGIRFLRYAGFGVMNRVGVVCYRIGNASYAIPSNYDARKI